MARYTVHVPKTAPDRAAALERAVFVADGWSWGAFAFGPLWLMRHRHWISGFIALAVMIAFHLALAAAPIGALARIAGLLTISTLWGLEGSSLRRLALGRAGHVEEGIVVGDDPDTLERRFFEAADDAAPARVAPLAASAPGVTPQAGPAVLGIFPEPGLPFAARKHP